MLKFLKSHSLDWLVRLSSLFEKSALILIVPAVALLYAVYPPIIVTNLELMLYVLIFVGVAIIITRLVFPGFDFDKLISAVITDRNMAAALVVVAMIVFFIAVFLGLLQWAPRQG
jgi:hypothetical protein